MARSTPWVKKLFHIYTYDNSGIIISKKLEGQIKEKKGCVRPRTMFSDWLLKTEEATIGYEELKMMAQDRSSSCQWQSSHSFTDKKIQDFSRTFQDPMKNFTGPFRSPRMFKYKEKTAFTYNIQSVVHCVKIHQHSTLYLSEQ